MKQVIIVRRDLKLPKGKLAGQCCHASVSAYRDTCHIKPGLANDWFHETKGNQKKIIVWADDEAHLVKIHNQCYTAGIVCKLIRDAGKTVLEPNTVTCIGIGPDTDEKLDPITRELKLL